MYQFDGLLCCFRKKLGKLTWVLGNEKRFSCKAMIQTTNMPHITATPSQRLNVSMFCHEIVFVIYITQVMLVWRSLMSLSEL